MVVAAAVPDHHHPDHHHPRLRAGRPFAPGPKCAVAGMRAGAACECPPSLVSDSATRQTPPAGPRACRRSPTPSRASETVVAILLLDGTDAGAVFRPRTRSIARGTHRVAGSAGNAVDVATLVATQFRGPLLHAGVRVLSHTDRDDPLGAQPANTGSGCPTRGGGNCPGRALLLPNSTADSPYCKRPQGEPAVVALDGARRQHSACCRRPSGPSDRSSRLMIHNWTGCIVCCRHWHCCRPCRCCHYYIATLTTITLILQHAGEHARVSGALNGGVGCAVYRRRGKRPPRSMVWCISCAEC